VRPPAPELDPSTHGFGPNDLDRPIFIDGVLGLQTATVNEMLAILKRTYCSDGRRRVHAHLRSRPRRAGCKSASKGRTRAIAFTPEGKRSILKKLIEGEGFEKFVHKRHPGTKRFGLDGGEAMIPALEQIIKRGGALGVEEIIFGMAHRGRLNVLAAVMGKPYQAIFHEFQGGSATPDDVLGSGDVKYHLGASAIARSMATTSTSRSPRTRRTSKSSTRRARQSARQASQARDVD
jgi:2-oxoglutarate dehydrogenase E1 component